MVCVCRIYLDTPDSSVNFHYRVGAKKESQRPYPRLAGDGGRRAVRSGLSATRRQRAVRSCPPAEPPGSLGSLPPVDTRADGHLPVAGPGAGALIASPDFLPRG